MSRRWFLAVLLLTAAVSASVLLLPLSTVESAGAPATRESLLTSEGPGMLPLLAVPVLLCAVPLLTPARRRRVAAGASAALLAAGALLAVLSIGVFFAPSALLLAVGAGRGRRDRRKA